MNGQIVLAIKYLEEFGPGIDAYVAKKNIRTKFGLPLNIAESEYKKWRYQYNQPKIKVEELDSQTHEERIEKYVTRCSFKVTKEQILEIKKYRELGISDRAKIGEKVGLSAKNVNIVLAFFSNSGIYKASKKKF